MTENCNCYRSRSGHSPSRELPDLARPGYSPQMRVAIVPGVDAPSEVDAAACLAKHVRDAELREQLSVVPEKLTAAEALNSVLDLGSPLDPRTILIRLGSYEVLDEDTAEVLQGIDASARRRARLRRARCVDTPASPAGLVRLSPPAAGSLRAW